MPSRLIRPVVGRSPTSQGAQSRHLVHVEAHLEDGTVLRRTVKAPRGSEDSFASDADVDEKYEKLARVALARAQVERLRDAVLGLEQLDDAAQLARLMAKV